MPTKTESSALEDVLADINKCFGMGSVQVLSSSAAEVPVVSTGLPSLDRALGVGGLPRGRIVEVYGPYSSGKTSLALSCVAQFQKAGLTCAYIDMEFALDVGWCRTLGVDVDNLLLSQPDNGNQALDIAMKFARSGAVGLIVIDSVSALVPRAELEGEAGDAAVGAQARLMSQALRKLSPTAGGTNTTIIFINQLREKIGVMYGSPEVTSGGKALPYYASVRLDVRRVETTKEGGESVANQVKIKIPKNKLAPPYRETIVELRFGEGFVTEGDFVDHAIELGFIQQRGSWVVYEGETLGQGRKAATKYLEEHQDVRAEIQARIDGKP